MTAPRVRPLAALDRDSAEHVLRELTAGPEIVSRCRRHDGRDPPGLVAENGDARVGIPLRHELEFERRL